MSKRTCQQHVACLDKLGEGGIHYLERSEMERSLVPVVRIFAVDISSSFNQRFHCTKISFRSYQVNANDIIYDLKPKLTLIRFAKLRSSPQVLVHTHTKSQSAVRKTSCPRSGARRPSCTKGYSFSCCSWASRKASQTVHICFKSQNLIGSKEGR